MLDEAWAADREDADDARASFTLRVAESALDYADDRFGVPLELITTAYRDGIFAGDDQRLRLAHMWHGELLSVHDRDEEAFADRGRRVSAPRSATGRAGRTRCSRPGTVACCLRVGRSVGGGGHPRGAASHSRTATRAAGVLDAAGIVALGRLAIHTGDAARLRRLDGHRPGDARTGHAGGAPTRGLAARACGMRQRATTRLPTSGCARRSARAPVILPRFPLDIADEVLLVRIALAAHDDDLARLALAATSSRAAQNPAMRSIAAVAVHVRALVERDAHALREAADLFETQSAAAGARLRARRSRRSPRRDRSQSGDRGSRPRSHHLQRNRGELGRAAGPQSTAGARRAPPHRHRRTRDPRMGGDHRRRARGRAACRGGSHQPRGRRSAVPVARIP